MTPTPRRLSLHEWRRRVDQLIWEMTGCGIDDLPTCNFFDMHGDGTTPRQAARTAVLAALRTD